MSGLYESAGVNLEAGYESVRRIKSHVERTQIKGALNSLGAFGAMFDLSSLNLKEPLLVSATDGVGTKLLLAIELGCHHTIGQDAVAMCVNDILAQGAEPLYFLDYIAVGKNDPTQIEAIVRGVADGCVLAQCALIGGETAEMPGMYAPSHYDIAGFAVGAVEKSRLITGAGIKEGDLLVGLPSSGVHSNGYSLVRKILADRKLPLSLPFNGATLGEELLTPTRIYAPIVKEVLKRRTIKGMVHITGGGFYENIPRILPRGLGVHVQAASCLVPEIFYFLQKEGNVPLEQMYNVFNMGIGFIFAAAAEEAEALLQDLTGLGENPQLLGKVIEGKGVTLSW